IRADRRARDVRRREDRGTPLQPVRARAVAAPFGDLAGRRRHGHRVEGDRLPPRDRSGRVVARAAGGDIMTATSLDAPLAPLDVTPRIDRLRTVLASKGIDALLVTKLANVRYLTGFTGSAGVVLVRADDALLVT